MQSDRYWNNTLFCTVVTFSNCLFRDLATIAEKTAHTTSVKKIVRTLPLVSEGVQSLNCTRFNSRSVICLGIIQPVSKNQQPFKITRAIWLRINSCIENTRHLIQTKERDLDLNGWHSKNVAKDLLGTPKILPIIQIWGLLSPRNSSGPRNPFVKMKCTCFDKLIF